MMSLQGCTAIFGTSNKGPAPLSCTLSLHCHISQHFVKIVRIGYTIL